MLINTSLNYKAFFALIITTGFLAGCSSQKNDDQLYVIDGVILYVNTSPEVQYIGSKQCTSCHSDIYEEYQRAEMGRSMSMTDSLPPAETASSSGMVYDSIQNYYYSTVQIKGKVFQRETRLDQNGKQIHERLVSADYVIGSGNNLKMFFHNEGGMLYEMPITWYAHKKEWDFSPGYREFGNLRFDRFADARCLSCHNSYLPKNENSNDRYTEPFTLGIGCERCHGPGELHVRQKTGEEIKQLPENARTIVNPRKLSSQRQLDVCRQCHLQGKAWAPRDKENWYGFRPGMLLSEHRSVYFPASTSKEVFEVADSPHRLSLSRCFKESNGTLTCITCHNPHRSIKTFNVDHFNKQCMTCHTEQKLQKMQQRHQMTDNCVSCHMKSTGTENTLHGVSNTDHWIRVDANTTNIDWTTLRTPADQQPIIRLVADVDNDDEGKARRLGIAYYDYFLQYDRRFAYLDSALTYLTIGISWDKNNATGFFYLGEIYREQKRFGDAIEAYNRAIELDSAYEKAYYRSSKIFFEQKKFAAAIQSFQLALTLKPNDPVYLEGLGMALAENDQVNEAVEILERSVAIDKQNPSAYSYLGNLYALSLNRPEEAIDAFKQVVTLDPDLPDGHLNLANTYAMTGNYNEAIVEYKKEITARPSSASAYFNLGRTYELMGNNKEARASYRKAIAIDSTLHVAKQYLEKLER